jgi:hypothetical protein
MRKLPLSGTGLARPPPDEIIERVIERATCHEVAIESSLGTGIVLIETDMRAEQG